LELHSGLAGQPLWPPRGGATDCAKTIGAKYR
jgi:hypothetical protein